MSYHYQNRSLITEEQSCNRNNTMDFEVPPETMKLVLGSIAQEVQRYHRSPESTSQSEIGFDEILKELKSCKCKLRLKKVIIKSLHKNLQIARVITANCMSANKKETETLNNQMSVAREECAILTKKNDENFELIKEIRLENQSLKQKLENISHFIELGYQELQKIRNEAHEDLSLAMKLKHIIISCGEYYANYCNEHDKCAQLEQRNRFLTHKLQINDFAATNLKHNKQQNIQAAKYKNIVNNKKSKQGNKNSTSVGSECTFDQQSDFETKDNIFNTAAFNDLKNIDLSSHLKLVKSLLYDQDSILEDLKQLKQELELK